MDQGDDILLDYSGHFLICTIKLWDRYQIGNANAVVTIVITL